MSMFKHTSHSGEVGSLVRLSVVNEAEIRIDTLRSRLEDAEFGGVNLGLKRYAPDERAYSDALRCAFTRITRDSKSITMTGESTGIQTQLLFRQVPRVKGDDHQKWGVHECIAEGSIVTKTFVDDETGATIVEQEVSEKGGTVRYEERGYVVLYDKQKEETACSIKVPPALSGYNVTSLAQHYIEYADATKLRVCMRDVMHAIAAPLCITKGLYFIGLDKHDILEHVFETVFSDVEKGEVSAFMYKLSGAGSNLASLKKDVKSSVGSEIQKIVAAIVKAKASNSDVTKSMALGWLDAIENIKANMATFNLLDMEMPSELEDLEMEVAALKAEADKPKKKRMIQIQNPNEEKKEN